MPAPLVPEQHKESPFTQAGLAEPKCRNDAEDPEERARGPSLSGKPCFRAPHPQVLTLAIQATPGSQRARPEDRLGELQLQRKVLPDVR